MRCRRRRHAAGLGAEVRLGVPDPTVPPSAACVIVALKSRTAPTAQAVAESVAAARTLGAWDTRRLYQKYCSTFDSTDRGNIGPVADALVDEWGAAASVGTPVTPAVGRTMHRGHLFVGDRLLSESSLAQHPLTPMHDPDLVRVLGRQTPHRVGLVPIESVRAGSAAVVDAVRELRADGTRHILLDAVTDGDLDAAAAAVAASDDLLLGGAAGLAVALARRLSSGPAPAVAPAPDGRGLILSGSGSERTRARSPPTGDRGGSWTSTRSRRIPTPWSRRPARSSTPPTASLWSPPPQIPTSSRACRSAGGESAPPP